MAKFEPKLGQRSTDYKDFQEGAQEAVIARAQLTQTNDGTRDMLKLRLTGDEGESGFYNITFGDELGVEQLMFTLTSIMENGFEIPEDIDWGYNTETAEFLKGKPVYVEVKNKTFKGQTRGNITRILNQEEFDAFYEG